MNEIMLLGSFHFSSANDLVNKKHPVSEADILDLVNKLAEFRPDKILVEFSVGLQDKLNHLYSDYILNDTPLGPNEVYQIAFRLGKKLDLKTIHCVDWNERVPGAMDMSDVLDVIKASDKAGLVDKFYRDVEDSRKQFHARLTRGGLLEAFKMINRPEEIVKSGWINHRLLEFQADGIKYGNQWLMGLYYRNLNITSNIMSLMTHDKLLVLYGSSHISVFEHMLGQHPNIKLVSPLDYL